MNKNLIRYMAADKEVCEYVRHTSRPFIFSASITPASVACARAALKILRNEPERVKRLKEISTYMRKGLKEAGVPIMDSGEATPIIPIYTYTSDPSLQNVFHTYEFQKKKFHLD